ncbi:MAG: hypothetical protein HFJ45_01645 [Clostridia bacterium]|nr:hypothetical protein [Clostridia bacterium]
MLDKIRDAGIGDIKPFKNVGSITVPEIPLLYRGGILKKGQVGLLEGNASEAVVPLENNKFWIQKVADEFKRQLNVEKSLVSTQASLQTYSNSSKTINNDNGVNINNTQNFYSKNSTPYEEQKQAKQQLRRLVYGL